MTNETIRIRQATPDDLLTVVSFNRAIAEETEGKTLDAQVVTEGVRTALGDPARSLYFMAECNNRVVGQTMVTFEWSDWRNGYFWWIQSVYVAPDSRRRGVFRALYKHIQDLAKGQTNVCGIRLYVYNKNERALQTYRDLGMTVTDYWLCEEAWR